MTVWTWLGGTAIAVGVTVIAWSLVWIVVHGSKLARENRQREELRVRTYKLEHELLDGPYKHRVGSLWDTDTCDKCWADRARAETLERNKQKQIDRAMLAKAVEEYKVSLDEPRVPPAVRNTDPGTSHKAVPTRESAKTQRVRLLWAYHDAGDRGLTNEEAGKKSGLWENRTVCYWKRCSELNAQGLIRWAGMERAADSGRVQQVHIITEAGENYLRGKG